jgi:putative intracellular protease/amidase
MQDKKPLQVAILLYPGVTALDAVGPWEVLSLMPDTKVRFVGKETGPVVTEGDTLLLGITHTLSDTPAPDILLVPGGTTTPGEMVDDEVLDWLRQVHRTTTWTTSVCSGALILGAAGILKGLPATTHWYTMSALRLMGGARSRKNALCKPERSLRRRASRQVSTWLCGLPVRSPDKNVLKRFSCTSSTIPIRRLMPGTPARLPNGCASWLKKCWIIVCPPASVA